MNEPNKEITDPTWKSLYKISGVATLVMMMFFLFDIIVWIALGPYPRNAESWFVLLQNNRPVGLLLLSFPTLFGMMLYYLFFFALYSTLRQVNRAYTALAALFAFIGLTVLLVTNMAYPMVFLSDQYAAATTEPQRIFLLAAGETKIATINTGVKIGGFFVEGAAVIFSVLMLRSNIYGKKTAYLGIVGHGLDLIRIIMILAFLPERIGAILLKIGGLPQLIWLILVGRKFIQLGRDK
ncbi:MAG: hypothetical protein ACETWQ_13445 [Phycisphaerae bacterium]